MATITEDYVSFETAKLLKEKGFDVPCMGRYSVRSKKFHLDCTKLCNNGGLFECSAPTHQMAMKWLREVYELYIEVSLNCDREDKNAKIFDASIFNIQNQRYKKLGNIQGYEEAVEETIKYCLENIICKGYLRGHKGNCRFCKERRQKELEELIIKLKEK